MPAGRPAILGFIEHASPKTEVVGLNAFWDLKKHEIPIRPGAYVLVADTWFQYPTGRSPVFYIGQSDDLRFRLNEHLKYATHVKEDRRVDSALYFPRYEYGGRFGKSYAYLRTWQRLSPRTLEADLMACFAKQYGTFPVANGAGSWDRLSKHMGPPKERPAGRGPF